MEQRYFSIADAAGYLGLTEGAVRKMTERRLIPFARLGKRRTIRLDRLELDKWVTRNTTKAAS